MLAVVVGGNVLSGPSPSAQFEELFLLLMPGIRRYAARTVGQANADDVVNETFTIVWRKWSQVPSDELGRRAWTYKVAHNVISHHFRSEARRFRLFGRASQARPVDVVDPAQTVALDDWARRAIDALPLAEREALALTTFADLSAREAAAILGCSTTALSSRLTRARRRIAEDELARRDAERAEASR